MPSDINEIANFAFISGATNRAFSDKTPDLPGIIKARGSEALDGQRVPNDPQLWTVDKYPQFLAERRGLLAQAVNDFILGVSSTTRPVLDIESLIAAGESDLLEFKETARYNIHTSMADKELERAVVRTVAGFMNANGGTLAIGVNDPGIPTGLDRDLSTLGARPNIDGYQQFLRTLFSTAVDSTRAAAMTMSFPQVEASQVCLIKVSRSPQPVYVRDGANQNFYVRVGNTTQTFNIEQAHQYIREHFSR